MFLTTIGSVNIKGYVTAVCTGDLKLQITVAYYEASRSHSGGSRYAVHFFIYGSEFQKGTNGMQGH